MDYGGYCHFTSDDLDGIGRGCHPLRIARLIQPAATLGSREKCGEEDRREMEDQIGFSVGRIIRAELSSEYGKLLHSVISF